MLSLVRCLGPTAGKEDKMEAQSNEPVHTAPNQGQRFLLVGAELVTFKLRGEDYSVFENATQGGYGGPPPHRHLRQDEGFYVLEGEFTFHVEGEAIPATEGAFVNVPKGSLHTFENTGTGVGRLLGIVAPAGDFEEFVEEVAERVSVGSPPTPPSEPPDADTIGRIVAAGERHHLEMPPPPGEQH
jgi:mannose-6-phosphate isomerase-like protein (cupin superfamily)